MIELHDCGVRFDSKEHRYFLGEKELQGITSTLLHRAFPNQYSGVPDHVLAKAADRGSRIHTQIELLNSVYDGDFGEFPVAGLSPELASYYEMVQTNRLKHIASEYIVTDGERYASPIDGVYTDADGGVVLVDYKTTYKLYYENVSLQLSIYAKFFEQCNPELKVSGIACMWMRDHQSRFALLPRVEDKVLDALIKADIENDASYVYSPEVPNDFFPLEEKYVSLARQIGELQQRQDKVKADMLELMKEHNAHSYRTASGTFSFVDASKSTRFDAKAFKEAQPEEYLKYMKESETKAQLRVKIKD